MILLSPLKTLCIIPQYACSGVICQGGADREQIGEKCVSPRKIKGARGFWCLRARDKISFDTTAARLRSKVCRGARVTSGPILRGEAGEGEKARATPKSRPAPYRRSYTGECKSRLSSLFRPVIGRCLKLFC